MGAAAPTLTIFDKEGSVEAVFYWVRRDLSGSTFPPLTASLTGTPRDVDAGFCEFTCVMVPRAVFEEIGLLDDNYRFHYEDADFGLQMWLKDYRALSN